MLADTNTLSEFEARALDLAVRVAEFLGFPRSMGELYGLIFVADQPLHADNLIERLRISRGSASQGLSALKRLGAIRSQYVPGDRREYFVAENNLNHLLQSFLKERVEPGLADLSSRLEQLQQEVTKTENTHFKERLAKVKSWRDKIEKQLPLLLRMFTRQ